MALKSVFVSSDKIRETAMFDRFAKVFYFGVSETSECGAIERVKKQGHM